MAADGQISLVVTVAKIRAELARRERNERLYMQGEEAEEGDSWYFQGRADALKDAITFIDHLVDGPA